MATKKASKKKAGNKKVSKKAAAKKVTRNSEEDMEQRAAALKKGAKKAKKAAAKKGGKKKAADKGTVKKSKAQLAREEKALNKKLEGQMSGKSILGKKQILLINPKHIVIRTGFNPRIDKGDIAALERSIKRNGVKQPLTVKKVGRHYELVDGERRLTAALKVALPTVPCQLEEAKTKGAELLLAALVSNDGKPLAPVEEAGAFRRLVNEGLSPRGISVATGKSLRLVKDRLTLISAHPDVAAAIKSGKLSLGLGLAIAKKAKSKKKQAKKVKEATRGKAATKRVATTLGKASLKTKFDKEKIKLQNRLNKLVGIVNKKRKAKERMPAMLSRQATYFSKHKDREVRAAFVSGGVYAITDVLAGANAKKGGKKKGRTATGKQTRQVRGK